MSQLVKRTREEWISEIDRILRDLEFIKENEDFYKHEFSAVMGGQTMIINGQRVDSPGQHVTIKMTVTFDGDGYIADDDGESNKQEFTSVLFEAYINNEKQLSYHECIYWDEPEAFERLIMHILQKR